MNNNYSLNKGINEISRISKGNITSMKKNLDVSFEQMDSDGEVRYKSERHFQKIGRIENL